MAATWIDLLDPTPEELRAKAPQRLEETALERLLAPPEHADDPRPTLQGHGDYVFGVLLIAVAVPEVFPREGEVALNAAYDKFLRASDGLDLARDLLAGVRDYSQAKIANDQNEVMKRLTVVASLLLLPTFIVGLYGQNFVDIPELRWHLGYAYVWGLIVGTTALQLWWFRRKQWV